MIKFTIGGRSIDPGSVKDAMMGAILEGIRSEIVAKVGSIREPDTGEFPTIVVRGESIDKLVIEVEGSPQLVALVKERLDLKSNEAASDTSKRQPRVFLSYTSDNIDLARKVATALEGAGIETWWDQWCISPGDSLRRKIDEGISECTHFVVLLTPQSIAKPWVNQEMDAGLVRKLRDQCKFIPVRYRLEASALPPLLSGILSPEISSDADISQLVNDIYEVTKRPLRGAPPEAVQSAAHSKTGYSASASAVARLFVERSKHGLFADPQFTVEKIAEELQLSIEDTEDALHELSAFLKITGRHVLVNGALFAKFDQYWKPWNPAGDALRLSADVLNSSDFPADCQKIAELYGWEPRRLNSAIHYLMERSLIVDYRALGIRPWAIVRVVGNDNMRRFVKSRS